MRHTRRILLAGAVAAAAALTGDPAGATYSVEGRREVEQYLRLSVETGAGYLGAAVAAARATLGDPLAERLEERAAEYGVSTQDLLSYYLMEALPAPRDLLIHYLPRTLAFTIARRPGQSGMLGAAFLPTTVELTWRQGEGYAGLGSGIRPGLHLGMNQGIAMATLCGPDDTWLGVGVPPALAAEHCLETTRSLQGALETLAEITTPRPCLHLLYDTVTGEILPASRGGSVIDSSGQEAVLTANSLGPGGEANLALLRRHLEANFGWVTIDKAMDILGRALPGSVRIVLDIDNREGSLLTADGSIQVLSL